MYVLRPAWQDAHCLQRSYLGYPGNCQFSSFCQCMATASGTDAYCGIDLTYALARR
ncbi:DUF3551 domain-containing protein [Bradyrhizobium sp. 139]|uniref:DUF3551 domain-containing protein n=1 Tax=Bradyrhizobium sp. 139 TaxID=2782616 RepID=UPI0031FF1E50